MRRFAWLKHVVGAVFSVRAARTTSPHAMCAGMAALVVTVAAGAGDAAEPASVVRDAFASEPAWEGFRNRLAPERTWTVRQDFGYRQTNRAGGQRAGEIGGFVQRHAHAGLLRAED